MSDKHEHEGSFDYQKEVHARIHRYQTHTLGLDPIDWERCAKQKLGSDAAEYLFNTAGSGQTYDNNLAAFRKWAIVPRCLASPELPDLSVRLFGAKHPYPIALAPMATQKLLYTDGELASARAAAAEHIVLVSSCAGSTSIEKVADANGSGRRWFQLYWPSRAHDRITVSLLSRARMCGFSVLVVSVDSFAMGWSRAMDEGYSSFPESDYCGIETAFSDPALRDMFREKYQKEIEDDKPLAAAMWARMLFPGISHDWEDLRFLRDRWEGPIVVKGIQNVADAKRCVAAQMDGILVSNGGGRVWDAGIGSLDALAEITEAVGDKIEIIFDSGVRSGTDVVKALALGARMVCIGRPWALGLVLQGEAGVRDVIRSILGELDVSLNMLGLPAIKRLDETVLRRLAS